MKRFIFLTIAILAVMSLLAQAPQAIKYQAVARDASGNILVNRYVSFRISIIRGSVTGTVAYTELHSKATNSFGLVDLEIGKGTSPTGSFSTINWGADSYFVNVEMDPAGGIAFQFMGASQLLSVPYALYANDVKNNNDADADPNNEIQSLSLSGSNLILSKGGGSIAIPSGDNWGSQAAVTDASLSGNGLPATPLKLAQQGAIIGQVLKWTGLIWQPGIDNGSLWSQNAGNIYFNTGKVGVGKDPGVDTRQFQVVGGTNMAIAAENSTGAFATLYAENKAAGGMAARFENVSGPVAYFGHNLVITDGTQGPGKVLTSDAGGVTSWQTPATVTPAGTDGSIQYNYRNIFTASGNLHWDYLNSRLGIGTNTPNSKLHIVSNSTTTDPQLKLFENDADYSRLSFQNSSGSNYWAIAGLNHATNSTERLNFYNSVSGSAMSISGIGNVAIGTDPNNSAIKFWVKDEGNKVAGYFENNGSNYTLYAKNLGTGPAGYFDGTVRIGGGNTSELNRDQTSTANLVPVCYGVIHSDGSKYSSGSTGNFTCERTSTGVYEITISGETYVYSSYVTVVTLISQVGFVRALGTTDGKLLINTYNTSGDSSNSYFNFVVYKP